MTKIIDIALGQTPKRALAGGVHHDLLEQEPHPLHNLQIFLNEWLLKSIRSKLRQRNEWVGREGFIEDHSHHLMSRLKLIHANNIGEWGPNIEATERISLQYEYRREMNFIMTTCALINKGTKEQDIIDRLTKEFPIG